jgi:hypothetical protein
VGAEEVDYQVPEESQFPLFNVNQKLALALHCPWPSEQLQSFLKPPVCIHKQLNKFDAS